MHSQEQSALIPAWEISYAGQCIELDCGMHYVF